MTELKNPPSDHLHFYLFLQTELYSGVRISEPSILLICNFSPVLETVSCIVMSEFLKLLSHKFATFADFCKLSSVRVSELPNPISYKFVILADVL